MATQDDPAEDDDALTGGAADLGWLGGSLRHALRAAQAAVQEEMDGIFAAEGLRAAHFGLLVVLGRNPGLRQNQAGFALGIQGTNLVPLVDDLERAGLAERRVVPGDRRARGLFLTGLGGQTLARLEAKAASHEARLAERLGPGGRERLLALLRSLARPG